MGGAGDHARGHCQPCRVSVIGQHAFCGGDNQWGALGAGIAVARSAEPCGCYVQRDRSRAAWSVGVTDLVDEAVCPKGSDVGGISERPVCVQGQVALGWPADKRGLHRQVVGVR